MSEETKLVDSGTETDISIHPQDEHSHNVEYNPDEDREKQKKEQEEQDLKSKQLEDEKNKAKEQVEKEQAEKELKAKQEEEAKLQKEKEEQAKLEQAQKEKEKERQGLPSKPETSGNEEPNIKKEEKKEDEVHQDSPSTSLSSPQPNPELDGIHVVDNEHKEEKKEEPKEKPKENPIGDDEPSHIDNGNTVDGSTQTDGMIDAGTQTDNTNDPDSTIIIKYDIEEIDYDLFDYYTKDDLASGLYLSHIGGWYYGMCAVAQDSPYRAIIKNRNRVYVMDWLKIHQKRIELENIIQLDNSDFRYGYEKAMDLCLNEGYIIIGDRFEHNQYALCVNNSVKLITHSENGVIINEENMIVNKAILNQKYKIIDRKALAGGSFYEKHIIKV